MKKILLFAGVLFSLAACHQKTTKLTGTQTIKGSALYGDSIKDESVYDIGAVATAMQDNQKQNMKFKGTITQVAVGKRCMFSMKLPNNKLLWVAFKDPKIVLPQTLTGKEVILEGLAYVDTRPADSLKNQNPAITLDKSRLAFEANGMVVL